MCDRVMLDKFPAIWTEWMAVINEAGSKSPRPDNGTGCDGFAYCITTQQQTL